MSVFLGKVCYMCHGIGAHLPHCPEMMDETARDKMFPGRKRAINEPVPPTTPSKSLIYNSHEVPFGLSCIAINGSLLMAFGDNYKWARSAGDAKPFQVIDGACHFIQIRDYKFVGDSIPEWVKGDICGNVDVEICLDIGSCAQYYRKGKIISPTTIINGSVVNFNYIGYYQGN